MKILRSLNLPDVAEGVVDSTLFGPALMLVEIGLELSFGLNGVGYKLPLSAKRQSANVAKRRARSASNKSDDSELAVGHGDMMAVRCCGVKSGRDEAAGVKAVARESERLLITKLLDALKYCKSHLRWPVRKSLS
jgi:hypothetical protein